MAFDPGKVSKLRDELADIAYEWMLDRVREVYGINDLTELSEAQKDEILEYSESEGCDTYVGMALRSMIE